MFNDISFKEDYKMKKILILILFILFCFASVFAVEFRGFVAKKLTPQQLSEAQELAAKMYEKINSAK